MARFARIDGDVVAEIIVLPQGVKLEDAFHPDIAVACVAAGAGVETGYVFRDGVFSAPAARALYDLRQAAIAILSNRCKAAIIGGYTSNALGSDHTYPSDETAQINMMGSVTGALIPGLPEAWTTPFWCADGSGDWQYRPHTKAQIIVAGQAGKAHVIANQTTYEARTIQVMAAQTAAEIEAIVSPEGAPT